MKESNNIEILNKACTISQEEVESYMNFQSLWDEYELSKISIGQILTGAIAAVDRQVLRRVLRTASIIILFGFILIKEDIDINPAPQTNIKEISKTDEVDFKKGTDHKPEEDIACLE